MSELFRPNPLPVASLLPFFQVVLSLSFLVLMIVIARLYRGIRILNARVDILSTVVRNLRKEVELSSGIDEIAFDEFDAVDAQLKDQLKGDFSLRKGVSHELEKKYSGRDLVRSSVDLDAVGSSKPAPQKSTELISYEAKESGLQVEVKSDFSYIAKPQENNAEAIPAIPEADAEDKKPPAQE